MRKICFNSDRIDRLKLSPEGIDPLWQYVPEREKFWGRVTKPYWRYVFDPPGFKRDTPSLQRGQFIRDNKVYFQPSLELLLDSGEKHKYYFPTLEEASNEYYRIWKTIPNKVDIIT